MSHLALRFIGILIAVGVLVALAAFPRPHASDAASPDEITISSLAAGGPVAVGATFTVDLRITASTAPHIAVQWEIAYDANLSYVAGSAGYTRVPESREASITLTNTTLRPRSAPAMTALQV